MIRSKYGPDKVIVNWRSLRKALPRMNEPELLASLREEVHGERRKDFIVRLHRKYARYRQERELRECFEGVAP